MESLYTLTAVGFPCVIVTLGFISFTLNKIHEILEVIRNLTIIKDMDSLQNTLDKFNNDKNGGMSA